MNCVRFFVCAIGFSAFYFAVSAPAKAPFPLGTEVEWEKLIEKNNSTVRKEFVESAKIIHDRLLYKGIPYENISQKWERNYLASIDKFKFMRKNGVDCTRLLRYIFINMLHLPYNSLYPEAPIISHTFADINPINAKQLKNFVRLPSSQHGFRPQTGDILAFPGHAIAVLDPENCISIQSSNWVCKNIENGRCVESEKGLYAGVAIYKLASKRFCTNGLWKGMDAERNKFTVAWRHRAFNTWIEKMPQSAYRKKRITLNGKNLAGKYLYFTGSAFPVRTTLQSSNKKTGMQTVHVTVPKDAQTGKLKIFWGTGRPNICETVESNHALVIERRGLTFKKVSLQ